MLRKQKFLITIVVVLELSAVTFLSINLHRKRSQVLGASVHALQKNDFDFKISGDLKHFYEPKANTVLNDNHSPNIPISNTINADTLNERFDYPVEKPADTYRIVTLGDSMTFGLYLNTQDNYSEQLEDMLNKNLQCKNIKKFEVINLGVSGYDIRNALERYKLRGAKYNPDLVTWFLINRNFSVYVDMFYDEFDYYNNNRITDPDPEQQAFRAQRDMYSKEHVNEIIAYETQALHSIRESFGKSLLLFSSGALLNENYSQELENFVSASGNTYFAPNIGNLIDKKNIVAPNDPHPNELGSKLIAEDLYRYLTDKQLIPCQAQ